MVDCSEFLEEYSDYRDGLLWTGRERAFAEHLERCASCARYHRVVGGGVKLARQLPELEPSDDFMERLQHRIYHLEMETAAGDARSSGVPLATALAISAVIGVSAWLPSTRPRQEAVQLPPVVAHAPHGFRVVPVLFRSGPLLTPVRASSEPVEPVVTALLYYSPLGTSAEASPAH